MEKNIKILTIETSCDETAAAVIGVGDNEEPLLLSSVVNSQIDIHAKTGGVVPEVASRAHMEAMIPVIAEALLLAKTKETESNSTASELDYVESQNELRGITHIAVTAGPGLVGSLLVGFNAAKTLAYTKNLPIVPINHIEGHIYSAFLGEEIPNINSQIAIRPENSKNQDVISSHPEHTVGCLEGGEKSFQNKESLFPLVALTVSGGHSSLTMMKDHGVYETIGETIDDAAGEAFDKVAQLLGLGYPGGPIVSKLASQFRNKVEGRKSKVESKNGKLDSFITNLSKGIVFPRPILNDGTFNFSFSGLKTAVLVKVKQLKKELYLSRHPEAKERLETKFNRHPEFISGSPDSEMLKQVQHDINKIELPIETKQEICAAFEDALVDVLVKKSLRAIEKYEPQAFVLAGGVAANDHLRNSLKTELSERYPFLKFVPVSKKYSGDNAAMIGLAAFYHVKRGDVKKWNEIKLNSNFKL